MVDSKENYKFVVGIKGLIETEKRSQHRNDHSVCY